MTKNSCAENQTLIYLIDKEKQEVLLIEKKRGLGKGLINAPGGKVHENEPILEGALRELKEEIRVELKEQPHKKAVIFFVNKDRNKIEYILGHVYVAYVKKENIHTYETEEAKPFWVKISDLDYSKMWEDDVFWLPHVLEGKEVYAEFYFDKWVLKQKHIKVFDNK